MRWIVKHQISGLMGYSTDRYEKIAEVEAENPEEAVKEALSNVKNEQSLARIIGSDSQPVGDEFIVEPADNERHILIVSWDNDKGKLEVN